MLGLLISIGKTKNIIFNQYNISEEKLGIFSKKIDISDSKAMDVVRLGLVEYDYSAT